MNSAEGASSSGSSAYDRMEKGQIQYAGGSDRMYLGACTVRCGFKVGPADIYNYNGFFRQGC